MRKIKTILVLLFLLICTIIFSQIQQTKEQKKDLSSFDIYAKVIGVAITGLGTIFGLPLAIMNFKKTKAEIKKLEREAEALTVNQPNDVQKYEGYAIKINESHDINIQISADPRFLGPLLLLLDFIIAWIIIILISNLLNIFLNDHFVTIIVLITAGVLLIPILKESVRVRKILRPKAEN